MDTRGLPRAGRVLRDQLPALGQDRAGKNDPVVEVGARHLTLTVIGAALFAVAVYILPVLQPNDVAIAETTKVMYADGKREVGRIGDVRRTSVPCPMSRSRSSTRFLRPRTGRSMTTAGSRPRASAAHSGTT